MSKNLTQGEEIEDILKRMGVTRDELAEKVGIKPETLRKVMGGYQPASNQMMAAIRNAAKISDFFKDSNSRIPASDFSPYQLMELETLQKHFSDLSHRLKNATSHERKHILSNLRAMLDELEERELSPPPPKTTEPTNSKPASPEANVLKKRISDSIQRGDLK
jgi:transcriptional regulator with XRE-family HTH domain